MLKFLQIFVICSCCFFAFTVDAKLKVMASIYPMAEFCRNVGGNFVEVYQMIPDGTEPHDFEPSPKDLARLGEVQLLIYNGGVEAWAEQTLNALKKEKIIGVKAGHNLTNIDGKNDPHVWVSPKGAILEVEKICEAFCNFDKENATQYKTNTKNYVAKLKELDNEFTALQKKFNRKTFITSHNAFAHLAKDYNLTMVAVAGLSPDAEPTPKDLYQVMQKAKEHHVRYIFFETLTSPKLAELVAQETGCQTAVLDPLEGIAPGSKKTYLEIQKENLQALMKEFAQ